MIRLVEALHFRCLRYISQPLDSFHVLVGPNASGKTTFLDVLAFLGTLVRDGLDEAVAERTQNFHDLVWGREGDRFELAVEAAIPSDLRNKIDEKDFDTIRYQVAIGIDPDTHEMSILAEDATFIHGERPQEKHGDLFPKPCDPPSSILESESEKSICTIFRRHSGSHGSYYMAYFEVSPAVRARSLPPSRLRPGNSAFGSMPDDIDMFPVSMWLRDILADGVHQYALNSLLIRKASPPGQGKHLKPDGSNLPWAIEDLRQKSPERFNSWIAHLQTALPDIEGIETVERPEDRHRYLLLCYTDGLKVPSWMVSDGTLRLLALTLLAYLPDFQRIVLIEEPENGIHPRAVETVYQSLSSVYDAQVLLATHSPVVLASADPASVLCFAKTAEGATDIVSGRDHPGLRDWQGETNFSTLFAAGVLG